MIKIYAVIIHACKYVKARKVKNLTSIGCDANNIKPILLCRSSASRRLVDFCDINFSILDKKQPIHKQVLQFVQQF